jgi:branched-chain amino acid transport system permease protein
VLFALYGTYVLMWRLVIHTAGIYSFATLVTVGVAAYAASYMSANYGFGWPLMLVVATAAGALSGLLIAAPTIRLRGIYFALFTFGLAELVRATVIGSRALGTSQGIRNADSFLPGSIGPTEAAAVMINYYAGLALLLVALGVSWLVDNGRLGLRILTARESEPVAIALGVDVVRARFLVFIISSAVLGLAGGCYAAFYQGVSPSVFSFDLLILLLAMMIVGGIHSCGGVLFGTALLLFIDQHYLDVGAERLIAVGLIMLVVTLTTTRGLVGVPGQFRGYLASRRARRWSSPAGTGAGE